MACLNVKGIFLQIFKTKYLFLRSLWLKKQHCCRARVRNCRFFWNWTSKNLPDQQKCVGFKKSLHPTVRILARYSYFVCHGHADKKDEIALKSTTVNNAFERIILILKANLNKILWHCTVKDNTLKYCPWSRLSVHTL